MNCVCKTVLLKSRDLHSLLKTKENRTNRCFHLMETTLGIVSLSFKLYVFSQAVSNLNDNHTKARTRTTEHTFQNRKDLHCAPMQTSISPYCAVPHKDVLFIPCLVHLRKEIFSELCSLCHDTMRLVCVANIPPVSYVLLRLACQRIQKNE